MKTEMKAMARAYRDGEGYVTELAYKDIKLQNDRTYRVYLYPDSSPCAVDIDRRNKPGESVPGWRGLWHHRSRYRAVCGVFVQPRSYNGCGQDGRRLHDLDAARRAATAIRQELSIGRQAELEGPPTSSWGFCRRGHGISLAVPASRGVPGGADGRQHG